MQEAPAFSVSRALDVLALHEALGELNEIDPRKCRIVELRYFTGMRVDETARVMELSVATVRRELRMAEAWLHRAIAGNTE